MKVENPVALRFILQDELYLLGTDKKLYEHSTIPEPVMEQPQPEIKAQAATPTIEQPIPEFKTQVVIPVIEQIVPEVKTPVVSFNYLGQNLKRFLILVNYPELEFIAEAHLTALQNILKRKDLEINDVAILNMATYSAVKLDELISFFKPAKLLLLGQTALPQGIAPLVLNNPKILNGYTALYSFGFKEMMDSVENKKAFWEQMKAL
ncbi:hypothetical protein [Mucilaginibacter sp. SP1R1]|uniref:hypothetical protein n=1 Tax=Mucilaginibacter sp. SP1R1 TaxID=2723091 RepID=UPI0016166175|nr:hypothetical protein [Mucilaginibacter sp. SP1R1]MBB6151740.1 hypothetical protein [Mucilaginibacter sp. SP1R1]